MGTMEEGSRKRHRRGAVQKAVLMAVGIASIMTLALVAPNAVRMLTLIPGFRTYRRQKEAIARARKRLEEEGLVRIQNGLVRLTQKGKTEYARFALEKRKPPRRWDKRWRVLVFDIPEKRRGTRDGVRRVLAHAGFARLQDSVWVYPYDCEDFVVLLKVEYKIGAALLYMIVDSIENDRRLKAHFDLPAD